MPKSASRSRSTFNDSDYREQAEFRYAMRRFTRYSELQARAEGITPQQHLLLLMIRGHPAYPEVNIGDVADRMQIQHHSASLLVERTVQRGLLDRKTDKLDRRRALVSLTRHGQDILDRVMWANRLKLSELDDALFRSPIMDTVRSPAPTED